MTVQEALNSARDRLRDAGIAGAERDARWLMASALGVTPDRVLLHLRDDLSEEVEVFYENAISRRLDREPVSHILGGRWFYGRWFKITPEALDPRPETETLIERALAEPFEAVLDLGTGSGCILITLLAERATATGIGTDVAPAALDLAEWNAKALRVADRLAFIESDWFAHIDRRFDLIVSNPPYITAAEMAELAPEVRDFEPHLALTDGGDGLSAYRVITAAAPAHLAPGGRLLTEIGWQQGPDVAALFREAGLEDVTVHPDMDGKPRVVDGRMPTP